jgi:sRNA-binding protein
MSNESMLSLSGNLSPEVQNKLQKLAGKPSTTKSEAPKVNNTDIKASNGGANRPHKPKLSQEELEKRRKAVELHEQQRAQALALYNQHLAYFRKLYPNCFTETPKPLAIGIDKVILAEEAKNSEEERISQKVLRRFLAKYTRSVAYKEAMQSGSARINLQGEEVEKVSPEHVEIARKSLEDWRNKRAIKQNDKQPSQKQREKVTNPS